METRKTCQACPREWRSSQSCWTLSESKDLMTSEALTCITAYNVWWPQCSVWCWVTSCSMNTSTHRLSHMESQEKLFIWQMGALWPIQLCTGQANTGRGQYTCTLYANTLSHSLHTVTPPCPLVTNRQDRRKSRLRDTDTHINMHMSGLGSELGPELGHF